MRTLQLFCNTERAERQLSTAFNCNPDSRHRYHYVAKSMEIVPYVIPGTVASLVYM